MAKVFSSGWEKYESLQRGFQQSFHEIISEPMEQRYRCVKCGKAWTHYDLSSLLNPKAIYEEQCPEYVEIRAAINRMADAQELALNPVLLADAIKKENDSMIYDAIFVKKASKKSKDEEGATDEIIFECRVISESEANAYWRAFIKYCEKYEAPEGAVLLNVFDPKTEITLRPFRGGGS